MAKRLNKVITEFNVGVSTIVDFLLSKGHEIDSSPNTKIPDELYELLEKEFSTESSIKKQSKKIDLAESRKKQEVVVIEDVVEEVPEIEKIEEKPQVKMGVTIVGKVDVDELPGTRPSKKKNVEEQKISKPKPKPAPKPKSTEIKKVEKKTETQKTQVEPLVETKKEEIPEEEIFVSSKNEIENNVRVVGQIDLDALNQKMRPDKKSKKEKEKERLERKNKKTQAVEPEKSEEKPVASKTTKKDELFSPQVKKIKEPTIVGQIHLDDNDFDGKEKKRRKRIKKGKIELPPKGVSIEYAQELSEKTVVRKPKKGRVTPELSTEEIDRQIKDTMASMSGRKSKSAKYRRDKRDAVRQEMESEEEKQLLEEKILKVTEFISANDLSTMMNIDAGQIISACMSIGLFISLNQRLDAETIVLVAEEFGFEVEFVSADIQEGILEEEDNPEDLVPCPPIVTIMGHVDHGKTSLLDYVRKTNVIAGEAGGITQHVGAYSVSLGDNKKITFLDTPGHEAFTAMRARGAQVTDIVIIVIAADDSVMPQTVEAINHAAAAGVPIVFAINKVDKENANPDKIREQLANMNYLVEEWGGKYQSQEISAKFGKNVNELMEKVLLEAELLELKVNPNKKAVGTVIESELDKGRGYVSTVLVSAGTLRVGDIILAGMHTGKIKAMFNERNQRIAEVGPASPATILGLDGAPQAGDKFHILNSEKDARDIANKRERLQREQDLKTQKHITLDEIGRRIAIGNFQELNIIIKGDVDGSIEAIADSLIKLSTEEIVVNVKHKAVGQISESDVLLASASDAIIIGFQVRPSLAARKLAEKEGIDIRLYSIIYDAIDEVKDAMSGMLSPEIKEEITGTAEIRETFKIPKVGTIAGCFVIDGKVFRNSKIRLIRDGIVITSGDLGSLKRFKDDVKEVGRGFECGLNIANYNDIQIGDIVEAYEEKEVKRKL